MARSTQRKPAEIAKPNSAGPAMPKSKYAVVKGGNDRLLCEKLPNMADQPSGSKSGNIFRSRGRKNEKADSR
jgi:hypothetical protein